MNKMENNNYVIANVKQNGRYVKKNTKSWRPLLRQIFVWSGVIAINMTCGMSCGIPNVMIPQLRREANSTEAVSEDMASWFTSVIGYATAPWLIILPIVLKKFGRKIPFILMGITTIIAYTILYFSTTNIVILIGEICQGILIGSNLTMLVVIITEYTSPCYRGIFMTFKTSSFFWGLWIASAVGTFTHWKHISYFAFTCSVYSLTALFWPESPSWLAMKGRYEDCAKAQYWLKGYDDDSERDLKSLINSQVQDAEKRTKKKLNTWIDVQAILKISQSREFYKPLLICIVIIMLWIFTGRMTCSMYSLTVIGKMTNSESTAYTGMLIVEAIAVCSMNTGCFLSKYFKRRTLLFTSCTIGITFQFMISLYLYLIKLSVIAENHVVTLTLLTLFSITISFGPMILAYGLCGELTPLRFRSISLPILAIFSEMLDSTLLKIFPFMLALVELHGVFLFYGLSTSFYTLILFKYLPETKDKTLQEIENFFKQTESVISPSYTTSPLLGLGIPKSSPLPVPSSSPPVCASFSKNVDTPINKTVNEIN